MKNLHFKKFSLLLCMMLCILGLTACSNTTISSDAAKESTKQKELKACTEEIKTWATDMINFLDDTADDKIKEYAENSDTLDAVNKKDYIVNPGGMNVATVEFYNGWVKSREDLGELKKIDSIEVAISDEVGELCMVTVNATYANRTCVFEITVDEDLNLVSGAINPTYTIPEKMTKAAMNTLIGMGTVIVVLVFIAWIISMLKYVDPLVAKVTKITKPFFDGIKSFFRNLFKKKDKAPSEEEKASVDNAIAQIVSNETSEADDLELIAVIAAAIAASEGRTSTDGLIVRSIRRR